MPGPAGPAGNTVLYGATNPVAGTGVDGNFYINTTTNFIFGPKAAGAWPAGASLIGPAGAQGNPGVDGNTVLYGASNPTSGQGVNGNFYINTTNNNIFGPKAGGVWPTGTSLVGPQGPQGPQGVAGAGSPSTIPPLMDGAAVVGTSNNFSREDHVHPSDTSRAPLASPALTGTPTAPTPASGDNSTRIATTAFSAANEVRTDIVQSLTATQQTQARENIYAAPFDALAYNGMQINGSAEVSQELGAGNTTIANRYACDGWIGNFSGTMSVISGSGPSTLPGLPSTVYMSITTAQATIGAGDYTQLSQIIEGHRVSRLAWGTANAQPLTIGFWTAHQRPGTYSVCVRAPSGNPTYPTTYTQNAAGVWQYNVITIPGCTTGTWVTDNTMGISFNFAMAMGASFVAPSANAWLSGAYAAAPGQINGVAATTDSFRLTGFIVVPGIEAPSAARSPFIMRPYDQELTICRRYWRSTKFLVGTAYSAAAVSLATTHAGMRAAPTATLTAPLQITDVFAANPVQSAAHISATTNNADDGAYNFDNFSGLTVGRWYMLYGGSPPLQLDARL